MVIQNDAGVISLGEHDWERLTDLAQRHGWELEDPDAGGEELVSETDAASLGAALREILEKGEVRPNELIDDADAEEKLEEFLEMCEAGPLLQG